MSYRLPVIVSDIPANLEVGSGRNSISRWATEGLWHANSRKIWTPLTGK